MITSVVPAEVVVPVAGVVPVDVVVPAAGAVPVGVRDYRSIESCGVPPQTAVVNAAASAHIAIGVNIFFSKFIIVLSRASISCCG
jgi:uncharacterized membrane protein YdjX (TVP38/TMEM64 family)